MGLPATLMNHHVICPLPTPVPHLVNTIIAVTQCSVLIGGVQAARRLDMSICKAGVPNFVRLGAFSVKIAGQPAARFADALGHPGSLIVQGTPIVLIGDKLWSHAGDKYPTADAAAKAACQEANSKAIPLNKEYGGMIYKNPDGTYGYTAPNTNDQGAGYNANSAAPMPPDSQPAGDYHTHGDYSQNGTATADPSQQDGKTNADKFSQPDVDGVAARQAKNPSYNGYVGTPDGQTKKCDPSNPRDLNKPI
jgi:uncharacterized Zn-binding protein involved in type VI secretion